MLDLGPATRTLADIVGRLRDDQLDAPTPCAGTSVAGLLDHVDGFCRAFTAAAQKTPLESGGRSKADASHLGDDWRTRIPERLDALAEAWRDPEAWTGMTRAGGIDMPGEVCGVVALDEAVLHGWDLAVAGGLEYDGDPQSLEAAYGFVQNAVARNPDGTPGLFGPPVPVPDTAPLLHRLLGLSGRNPGWAPPAEG